MLTSQAINCVLSCQHWLLWMNTCNMRVMGHSANEWRCYTCNVFSDSQRHNLSRKKTLCSDTHGRVFVAGIHHFRSHTGEQGGYFLLQVPTLSTSLAFCEGNPPVTGGIPYKVPVRRIIGVSLHEKRKVAVDLSRHHVHVMSLQCRSQALEHVPYDKPEYDVHDWKCQDYIYIKWEYWSTM